MSPWWWSDNLSGVGVLPMGRTVLVLTGPVHSGKTSFIKGAAAFWDLAGFSCRGFLNEARLDGEGHGL